MSFAYRSNSESSDTVLRRRSNPNDSSVLNNDSNIDLDGDLPQYTDDDAKALFDAPPPPASSEPLTLPLALPQINSNYDAPFLRAYNADLAKSGINQDDWLKFIDGLNVAMTASPPLRIVDTAGMIIGFVPYHWCIIAGVLMQTGAQTAMHVLSKTLTDKYLKHANSNYFGPRRLRVRLMKTAAMEQFVRTNTERTPTGKLKAFGKGAARAAHIVGLHLPVARRVINLVSGPAPTIDPYSTGDASARRLERYEGIIMPVSTDVPPPKMPSSLLDKTSALAVKLQQWKVKRKETKNDRNRQLLAATQGTDRLSPNYPGPGGPGSGAGDIDPFTWRENKRIQRAQRRQGRRGGLISGAVGGILSVERVRSSKRERRLKEKVDIATRLEMLKTDGLVWLVLLNADQDAEIQGTELADNTSDEQVDDDTWNAVIAEEDEEDEEDAIELAEMKKEKPDLGALSTNEWPSDSKSGLPEYPWDSKPGWPSDSKHRE